MTAVEWLINEVDMQYPEINVRRKAWMVDKAKEMEKEQMLNAFQESRLTHPMIGFKHETFVDYYKQTFKSE